jgi:hypothetical protein
MYFLPYTIAFANADKEIPLCTERASCLETVFTACFPTHCVTNLTTVPITNGTTHKSIGCHICSICFICKIIIKQMTSFLEFE